MNSQKPKFCIYCANWKRHLREEPCNRCHDNDRWTPVPHQFDCNNCAKQGGCPDQKKKQFDMSASCDVYTPLTIEI